MKNEKKTCFNPEGVSECERERESRCIMFLLHELPNRLATAWRLLYSLNFWKIFFLSSEMRTYRTKITKIT